MATQQCRQCMRRRPSDECTTVTRHGGGTYRRAGRRYNTTICIGCIIELIGERTERRHAMETVDRFSFRSLVAARQQIRAREVG